MTVGGRRHVPPAVTPDSIRGPEPQAPSSPGFPRIGVRGAPGPRIKSGVTSGGDAGRRVEARGRRPPPRLALRSSCPDLFRASTSLRRLARARPAPRCRKTWMPGTSPGMTVGGASSPSWSAEADHPRVFAAPETKTNRGWSASADHDGRAPRGAAPVPPAVTRPPSGSAAGGGCRAARGGRRASGRTASAAAPRRGGSSSCGRA